MVIHIQAFFWPFQKNSSPKKLKDSKKTQANFPKTQESVNANRKIFLETPKNSRKITKNSSILTKKNQGKTQKTQESANSS